jgi:hypothetical protein
MWRCGDVEMWRCGDVEMWRCGDVEMWKEKQDVRRQTREGRRRGGHLVP